MNKDAIITDKELKESYEERNLRFYKLLGQNYEVIVSALLRGKDLYYHIPKIYQMNTKKPFILDWLLEYGRPKEITQVWSFGGVKIQCIYKALTTWTEQNPSDLDKWIYKKEWDELYGKKKRGRPPKNKSTETITTPIVNKKNITTSVVHRETKPLDVIIPDFKFVTKQGNFRASTLEGEVFITININKTKNGTRNRFVFHFRKGVYKKFESDYIVFAKHENRIYFKESDVKEGFKVSCKTSTGATVSTTIQDNDIPLYEPFCEKELDLKYDEIYKMYFVEYKEE